MPTKIQVRRGTASQWVSSDPVLSEGEIGFETDTGKFKIGDGSTSWSSLGYAGGDIVSSSSIGELSNVNDSATYEEDGQLLRVVRVHDPATATTSDGAVNVSSLNAPLGGFFYNIAPQGFEVVFANPSGDGSQFQTSSSFGWTPPAGTATWQDFFDWLDSVSEDFFPGFFLRDFNLELVNGSATYAPQTVVLSGGTSPDTVVWENSGLALSELGETNISSPEEDEVLIYKFGSWRNSQQIVNSESMIISGRMFA